MKRRDQPHDRYFKDLMEDIDVAKSFLKAYANPKIQAQIDWNTLELYDTSLIGAHDKQLYADVVYRAQTKGEGEMFLVLNHERKADRLLPIRRLEYKLGVLKKAIKQNKQPALIYFLTWYNGQEVPYPYAKSIAEYFTLSDLAAERFLQDEIIVAKQVPDEQMSAHAASSILELCMKHGDNARLLEWLAAHPGIVEQLTESRYLVRSLTYVSDVGYHKLMDLLSIFEQLSPKLADAMLTTTQQIRREVRQEIRKEVRQEIRKEVRQSRNVEIAKSMLQDREPKEKVSRWTGLDLNQVGKLLEGLS